MEQTEEHETTTQDASDEEAQELSRWADARLFWGAALGAAVGGPLTVWSPTLVENQRVAARGSFYGLESSSTWELFLGGTLFGALGGIVLVLLAFVAKSAWRAVAE